MATAFKTPNLPKDRTRLLACRVDLYAKSRRSETYAVVAKTDDVRDGFRSVTWAEFARAVDCASWWLDEQLGTDKDVFESFAYLGAKDLRYMALVVAAIKTGRKLFLPSPFLSITAVVHLLESIHCKIVVYGTPIPLNKWFDVLDQRCPGIRKYRAPEFQRWFDEGEDEHMIYEYVKSWDDAIDDPVLVLHSSGTTGTPKPITYRNSTFVYFDTQYRLGQVGPPLAINHFEKKRVWSPQPMAHLSGLYEKLIHPVYFYTVPVLSPNDAALTADLFDQMILHANITSGFCAPFLIEDFAARPASRCLALERLESIQYGTAPLNPATGKMLYQGMHVQPHYASTEMPFPPYLRLAAEDWEYFSFHACAGIEFCHRYENLFELVVIRKENLLDFQVIFTILTNATHFYSGDLWSPHQSKKGLWRYRGRTDDIIITSSGANIHATPIEEAIQEDPRVRSAIIGGKGKSHPFLLLEMTQDFYKSVNGSAFSNMWAVENVWPAIAAVNERLELHSLAMVLKEHIIVASAANPFPRLPKGSVDRRSTLQDFRQEIDDCFRSA